MISKRSCDDVDAENEKNLPVLEMGEAGKMRAPFAADKELAMMLRKLAGRGDAKDMVRQLLHRMSSFG